VIAEHQKDVAGSSASGALGDNSADTVFDVGFFYNHAIGDGLSGAAFHLDFLNALNTLGAETTSSKLPESLSLRFQN